MQKCVEFVVITNYISKFLMRQLINVNESRRDNVKGN